MERQDERIIERNIEAEMKTAYIDYAMSVIVSRALPDVRDGLKPVHRRILYSMHEDGITSDKPYRKCANTVGSVLGRYHPHGDSSVYDAMVRLAQDFSMRYMLIDGHGNFGSIDGDGAAAMRYTESRMSKIAEQMLVDIEKNTVDFMPNYDDRLQEPTVLPSKIPALLVNGSSGIAVGMATNIPPHNLTEIIDGTIKVIDNPDTTNEELMEVVKGPDFPTGAMILGKEGIRDAYTTGRGKIIVRAETEIEEMSGNKQRIIVTSLPYQVNKANLIIKIDQLVKDRKIEGISEVRDESDRKERVRIVIELKRDARPQVILNQLFKHTQMQDTFGVIMLALVDGQPIELTLKQCLVEYIKHRKEVVLRRTKFELDKALARAHILEGLKIAIDNIDEVIRIIRGSYDDPKERLIEAPTPVTKKAQGKIKNCLMKCDFPSYVFSGIRGKSYFNNAVIHKNCSFLYKTDISAFFPNISRNAVYNFFLKDLNTSPDVAKILTDICTVDISNAIEKDIKVANFIRNKKIRMHNHLCTGSPASPLLSYLANRKMFDEIHNIATNNNLTFSIYMDDIFFSSSKQISYCRY